MLPTPDSLLANLQDNLDCQRLVVALSGGLDSTVLLHLLATAGPALPYQLSAVHIHHGLQAQADAWQQHCEQLCAALRVPLVVERVQVASGASQEAQARLARYAVFERLLAAGDCLLMAHHADDQAETLLLRLLRGAGPAGLGGMPDSRELGKGRLYRPLLRFRRSELHRYAQTHGLSWIEDPSNQDSVFDRNFLRRQVLPLIEMRWPGYLRPWQRAMAHCREAQALVEDLATIDLAAAAQGPALQLAVLRRLPERRQRNLLRHWLVGRGLPVPDAVHLQRILCEVLPAAEDASPLVAWPGVEVRRYRGLLHAFAPRPEPSLSPQEWDPASPLPLPQGRLQAWPAKGRGLHVQAEAKVEVRFRLGGERCRPAGRAGSHPLKKLLQEAGVPPWERASLPLIYVDGELAAVADLWLCEGFQAPPGQNGWLLHWQSQGALAR